MSTYIKVFVGLGGFGTKVVKTVHDLVKADNDGSIPPHIRFAAFDSATHERLSHDVFPFTVDAMASVAGTPQQFLNECRKNFKTFERWWPGVWLDRSKRWSMEGLTWSERGFGQYRPFGRLGFLKHMHDVPFSLVEMIQEQVEKAARAIETEISATSPRIIIVNSMAGGTGSSSAIDVAYILRHKMIEGGGLPANAEILLFSVTGDASMAGRAKRETDSYKWAEANSFAFLAELDHWMQTNRPFSCEYPRYDVQFEGAVQPFLMANIIGMQNKVGKNLPTWKDYADYLAATLYYTNAKLSKSDGFASIYDNILKRRVGQYGSVAIGSVHYVYQDSLLFLFSMFAERTLNEMVLSTRSEQIREMLSSKQALSALFLYEDSYYGSTFPELNQVRSDSVLELLQQSYEDERGFAQGFPTVAGALSRLDIKPDSRKVQEVLSAIDRLDLEIKTFLNVKKRRVYDQITEKIKSELFFGKEQSVSLASLKELASQLHTIISTRVRGLEKDIPEVFEKIHYQRTKLEYLKARQALEKDPSKKQVAQFRQAFSKYFEILQLVFLLKTKFEIYKNLASQLEWYEKAIEEVRKPVEETILKHFRTVREGLALGTHSEHKKNSFTIYALPVHATPTLHEDWLKRWYGDKPERHQHLAGILNGTFRQALQDLPDEIGDLWQVYQVSPTWSEDSERQVVPTLLSAQKQLLLLEWLQKCVAQIKGGVFQEELRTYIPSNVFEALYLEAKQRRTPFGVLLQEKVNALKNLVEPFVVLKDDTGKTMHKRGEEELLLAEGKDLNQLFLDHGDDQELAKEKKSVEGMFVDQGKESTLTVASSGKKRTADSEHLTLVRVISGFTLDNYAPHSGSFRKAFEEMFDNEVFTDIRLRPGGAIEEVVFLMAEHYGIIDSKGSIFRYRGDTLEKGLKGREKTIEWFIRGSNPTRIAEIKKDLKKAWSKIAESDREGEFGKIRESLEQKRQAAVDDSLRTLLDRNVKSIAAAMNLRLHNSIGDNL
jgi:hypothetical protein